MSTQLPFFAALAARRLGLTASTSATSAIDLATDDFSPTELTDDPNGLVKDCLETLLRQCRAFKILIVSGPFRHQ
jgi:hypothetical protein